MAPDAGGPFFRDLAPFLGARPFGRPCCVAFGELRPRREEPKACQAADFQDHSAAPRQNSQSMKATTFSGPRSRRPSISVKGITSMILMHVSNTWFYNISSICCILYSVTILRVWDQNINNSGGLSSRRPRQPFSQSRAALF